MTIATTGALRRLTLTLALPFFALLSACSGGGDDGPCTTCPPPPPETGALRLEIEFDDAAKGGLEPSGFSLSDLSRIDLLVAGANQNVRQSVQPSQNRAFFGDLQPGTYAVTATGLGQGDLVLFTSSLNVTIAVGDTAEATAEMEPALGTVTLEIDGQTSGTVQAVAGDGVPFVVTVRNTQGRPVPGATVRLTKSTADYGQVLLDGTDQTNAQGRVTGVIDAAFSGSLDLSLRVDGRPISSPGPTRVEFATGVSAANSAITGAVTVSGTTFNGLPVADGQAFYEFVVMVNNDDGEPLPGVPVTPRSERNAGEDPDVDIIEPAPGFESGRTDATGEYRFRVRTFSSSFLFLNGNERLESNDGTSLIPAVLEVVADGVKFDERGLRWNSTVHPNLGGMTTSKQFVTANGQDFATIIVTAEALAQLGGGPVASAYIEIVDARQNVLNHVLDITPEPGFDGFRTNEQGEWRGRIRSDTKMDVFFGVKVDGRGLVMQPPLRSVFFQ